MCPSGQIEMQVPLPDQERRLATEQSLKYRGTASIKIDALRFTYDKKGNPDHENNVKRLKIVFRDEGCQRLKLQNHIPGIISRSNLDAAISLSGISPALLLADTYPKLDLPAGCHLECLHGQARVQAAEQFLPEGDERWTVDLYLAGGTIRQSTRQGVSVTYYWQISRRR
jgi:hypothetical protein